MNADSFDEGSMAESAERAFREMQQGGSGKPTKGLPEGVRQVLRLFASSKAEVVDRRDADRKKVDGRDADGRDAERKDAESQRAKSPDWRSSQAITIDRFRLIRPIGQGGFGVVYLARDTLLDRVVALKLPKPHVLLNDELRSRFLREARAASNLHHAHIAQVYDASEVNEASFIACEYCDGGSLDDWLSRQDEPLDPWTTSRLISQLADAVHYAHCEGILHRDLKPSNILLKSTPNSRTGEMPYVAKVADFGLAKLQSMTDDATLSGVIMGSIRYMSPEQALARPGGVDTRSDVYALGVIMYQLLTGRVPFDADSQLELLRDVVDRSPRHVRQFSSGTPRDLAAICMKCLEKEPSRRYQSAADLRDDLNRFLQGQSTVARPVGLVERVIRWSTQNRIRAALTSIIFVLLLVGITGLLFYSQRTRQTLVQLEITQEQLNLSLKRADEREEQLRVYSYCSEVALAFASWFRLRPISAAELLDRQRPAGNESDQRGLEWYLLKNLVTPRQQILFRAANTIHASVHPDGRLAALADESRFVRLINLETGEVVSTLSSPFSTHREVRFSPDGHFLAVSTIPDYQRNRYSEVGVFDMTNQTFLRRLGEHPTTVESLAFDPQSRTLLSASRYENLCLWDLASGRQIDQIQNLSRNEGACISPCGRWKVFSTYDQADDHHQLEVFDKSDQLVATIPEHRKDEVVCFTRDGEWMAKSSLHHVEIYKTGRFELLETITEIHERTSVMTFSPDDRLLYVGARDGTLRFWRFQPPSQQKPLSRTSQLILPVGCANLHESRIRSIAFDRRGRLISTSDDGTLRVTDPTSFVEPERIGPSQGKADSLVAAPDGTLAMGMHESNRIWLRTPAQSLQIELADSGVDVRRPLALSQDAKWLGYSWNDSLGVVRLDQPNQIVWKVASPTHRATALAFVPGHNRLISTHANDPRLYVWDRDTGKLLKTESIDLPMNTAVLSPNGRLLILGPRDEKYVIVRDFNTFHVKRRLAVKDYVYSAVFNNDGTVLATGHTGGQIGLWNTSTWELSSWLTEHHQQWLEAMSFSPDGRTLVSGGIDGTIRFWHVATGRELGQISHDPSIHVVGLAFAPDAQSLFVATERHPFLVRWPIPRP